eukprot:scaffold117781_cov28-Tisochrysis_lutea.AAC.1
MSTSYSSQWWTPSAIGSASAAAANVELARKNIRRRVPTEPLDLADEREARTGGAAVRVAREVTSVCNHCNAHPSKRSGRGDAIARARGTVRRAGASGWRRSIRFIHAGTAAPPANSIAATRTVRRVLGSLHGSHEPLRLFSVDLELCEGGAEVGDDSEERECELLLFHKPGCQVVQGVRLEQLAQARATAGHRRPPALALALPSPPTGGNATSPLPLSAPHIAY